MKVGDVIDGKYTLVRLLGEGGMGSVYEAAHARIRNKRAAVKLLRAELLSDSQLVARFEREAEAASAIGHEGIVDVYDFGTCADGTPYMVMEFLDGQSLEAMLALRRGAAIDIGLTLHVAEQVLSALEAAHSAGVVHRDLKPDNIFLVDRGAELPRIKLLDFGIARIRETGGPSTKMTLTSTGAVIGTPYYMSPEQAMGDKDRIDHRTDLWSLGVVLYRCMTGRFPFEGASYNQVLGRIITGFEPLPPGEVNPGSPPELARVVARAMSKDLDRRYPSAGEMLEDVRSLSPSLAARTELGVGLVPKPRGVGSEAGECASFDGGAAPTVHVKTQQGGASGQRARRPVLTLIAVSVVVIALLGLGAAAAFGLFDRADDAPVPGSGQVAPPTAQREPAPATPSVVTAPDAAIVPAPRAEDAGAETSSVEAEEDAASPPTGRTHRRARRVELVTSPAPPPDAAYGTKVPTVEPPTQQDYPTTKL